MNKLQTYEIKLNTSRTRYENFPEDIKRSFPINTRQLGYIGKVDNDKEIVSIRLFKVDDDGSTYVDSPINISMHLIHVDPFDKSITLF